MDISVDRLMHLDCNLRAAWRLANNVERCHRVTLGLHSHMRIVLQHLPANVTCDSHQGLFWDTSLGKSGYAMVPWVVKSQAPKTRGIGQ